MRLITSLLWLLGTALLMGSAALPFLHETYVTQLLKNPAQLAVTSIVDAQRDNYLLRNQYVYFDTASVKGQTVLERLFKGNLPPEFSFTAESETGSALVVRAVLGADAMRSGYLPPMVYEFRIDKPGTTGEGRWIDFTRRP